MIHSDLKSYDNKVKIYRSLMGGVHPHILDYNDYLALYIYNSVSIEGSTFTKGETKEFLDTQRVISKRNIREHNEILDLKDAFNFMEASVRENTTISEKLLFDYHWELIKRTQPDFAGRFKTAPNATTTTTGIKFYPSPEKVKQEFPKAIEEIVNAKKNGEHPLIIASDLHFHITCLHPFQDGNGRLARLAFEHIIKENKLPSIYIKNSDRKEYINTLQQNDITIFRTYIISKMNSYLDHILESLNQSTKISGGIKS